MDNLAGAGTAIDPVTGASGSGSAAEDGSGGASPGPGTGEGGGTGAEVVEQPPQPETPPAEGELEPAEDSDEPQESEESEEFDGRQIDAKTRTALAKLKLTDKESAKQLSEMYHRAQAIVKDVGAQNLSEAVNKVRGMTATMEAMGGEEGLTALNDEVNDYRAEIDQFSNGDPELIQQLYEANPNSLVLSTKNALEHLAAKNIELLDQAIIPTLVARLEQVGMYKGLANLAELIKDGKGQEAYDLTAEIAKFLTDAKAVAKNAVEMKGKVDPREREMTAREEAVQKKEAESYDHEINVELSALNTRALAKVVEPFFKDIKLPVDGRKEFVKGLQERIWKQMREDKMFQLQAKTIKARGEASAIAQFSAAKFAEFLPEAFRAYRNMMYPNFKSRQAAPAPANGAAAPGAPKTPQVAPLAAGARPRHEDVDWKSTSTLMWITGKAVLKNGKQISFDKNAPANRPA